MAACSTDVKQYSSYRLRRNLDSVNTKNMKIKGYRFFKGISKRFSSAISVHMLLHTFPSTINYRQENRISEELLNILKFRSYKSCIPNF